jgi:hypothetical protein
MSFSIKPILTRGTRIGIGFSLLVVLFTLPSCNDESVPPVEPPPGSRDYEWTLDTLRSPGQGRVFHVTSLWGSSPTNVWAVCLSSSFRTAVWHYDGTQWMADTQITSSDHFAIWGSSENDVWTCEDPGFPSARIWHHNGVSWSIKTIIEVPGYSEVMLNDVWGFSPDNVFFAGAVYRSDNNSGKGILLHYDGQQFSQLNIPLITEAFRDFRGTKVGTTPIYYLRSYKMTNPGVTSIYRLIGSRLTLISALSSGSSLNEVDGKVYVEYDQKIMIPSGDTLKLWRDMSGTAFGGMMWGRSEKDFFSSGRGGLGHFNGTDFVIVYPTTLSILNAFVLPKDVFVATTDDNSGFSIIIHGRLRGD